MAISPSSVVRTTIGPPQKRVRITGGEIREGIIDPRSYVDLYIGSTLRWVQLGGYPLETKCLVGSVCPTFNFFPFDKNPEIEWSRTEEGVVLNHALGKVAKDATIEIANFPSFNHPALHMRPTILMFMVTGHMMCAVYFHTKRELHLLNSWPLDASQQMQDVYTLLETALGRAESRKIRIVDIAREVGVYDLQEGEKVGFCTLWAGVISHEVLTAKTPTGEPPMTFLQSQVREQPTVGSQLSARALAFYRGIYASLEAKKIILMSAFETTYKGNDCTAARAALAVIELARRAV